MAYQTTYPFTNEVLKTYQNNTAEEVQAALSTAEALYQQWRLEEPINRRLTLKRIAQLIRERQTYLAEAITHDMGKLITEAEGEVAFCAAIADYYADYGAEMLKPVPLESEHGSAYYLKQAVGIVMAVEPWNFPMYQIMRIFAPNFMVGNPVIVKSSAICPGSAAAFAQVIADANAPAGSLTNLFINYDQVNTIIADPRVQGVCLTGSENAGAKIGLEAGENLKKSTLELGGNDAFIVLRDADMDLVTSIAPNARLRNCGQVCTSAKRFIVHKDLYEEFLTRLKANFASRVMGDPLNPNTTLAPLSSKAAQKQIKEQVDAALNAGATLYYQGEVPSELHQGCFYPPTILTELGTDNPMYDQEFFGPVAVVFSVDNADAAIALANNSKFGLGSSLFSSDLAAAQTYASRINAGMTTINGGPTSYPELPFGGIKRSGYGRELGKLGIESFINEHLVFLPNN